MAGEDLLLDSRLRRRLQNPVKILREIGLSSSHVFLDVGCGSGFLSIPAAELVGADGLVYAVDADANRLRKLMKKAEKLGLKNVIAVEADAADMPQVPDDCVDRAVMLLSLHHIENRREALREVFRKLRRDATLTIVEPIKARLLGHGTNPKEALMIVEGIGFEVVRVSSGLLTWRAVLRKS